MRQVSKKLEKIYQLLYKSFGPQDWWPAESDIEVIVGAMLTQNTAWSNVEKAIANLKRERALSFKKIHCMPQRKLASLIRPAGYFNLKAKRLKNLINFLYNNYQGDLKKFFSKNIRSMREELLGVNGVGEETADSIILYAASKPVFVIDAYTKRIFSRHGFLPKETAYADFQRFFMENLKTSAKTFNEYHALIVRLGKDYCSNKKPKCKICPLRVI